MSALVFDHVSVSLHDTRVLERLSLSIEPGKLTVLIGPNGSGKTTLMRCAAGIVAPTSGSVHVFGHDLAKQPVAAKSTLGFAVDPSKLPPELTGRQCIELFAKVRGAQEPVRGAPAPVLAATFALAERLGYGPWIDTEVAFQSLGTRQKLGVLLGLIGNPPLLLLDEVTNGLDPPSAFVLKQHLVDRARQGDAVLLATHALDIAERIADRVLVLGDGRIARDFDMAERRRDAGFSLERALAGTG